MQDHQPRSIELHVHVGQQVGDALMLDDRFVKLHTITRVSQRRFERRTGDAQCLRGDADAAAFEVGQGDGQAFAAFTQQVGFGNGAVVEGHGTGVGRANAHLVFGAVDDEPGGVSRHQER
ncbi:hypothetical protein D3C72_541650 [compost metagenome]